MNNRIRNLNIEDFLGFDIETVRKNEVLDVNSDEFDLFQYKSRDKIKGTLPTESETTVLYEDTAPLSAVYGKIVCISIGYIKNGSLRIKALVGEEVDIITQFFAILNKFKGTLGYNQLRFDLPYIRIRAYVNGIGHLLDDRFSDSDAKPWDLSSTHVDFMDVVRGASYQSLSLAEACYLFGIKSPKDDISGKDVSKVYYAEGVHRIATYCNKDVKVVFDLAFKLGVPGSIKEVVFVEDKVKSVFEQITEAGSISDKLKSEIEAVVKSMKKADRVNYVTLLKASLGRTEFSIDEEDLFTKILTKK